jgi:hypothetical protein
VFNSAGLTIWQKRHMPRARAFGGSSLTLFYFSRFFGSLFQRGAQTVRRVRDSKEPKSPRKREAPKFKKRGPKKRVPKRFFPVSVLRRGAPKGPRSPENVRLQKLKIKAPKSGAHTVFGSACFSAGSNLVPRAFPFLSLGRREKALAPGGLLCILIGQ